MPPGNAFYSHIGSGNLMDLLFLVRRVNVPCAIQQCKSLFSATSRYPDCFLTLTRKNAYLRRVLNAHIQRNLRRPPQRKCRDSSSCDAISPAICIHLRLYDKVFWLAAEPANKDSRKEFYVEIVNIHAQRASTNKFGAIFNNRKSIRSIIIY